MGKDPTSIKNAFLRLFLENNVKDIDSSPINPETVEDKVLAYGFDEPAENKIPEPASLPSDYGQWSVEKVKGVLDEWRKTKAFEYAFILHDKDKNAESGELVKPHIHMVIRFSSPTKFNQIKAKFPQASIQATRNPNQATRYLVHADSVEEYKFRYSWDDIVRTEAFPLDLAKMQTNQMQEMSLDKLYEMIKNDEITLSNYQEKVPISLYAKYKNRIQAAIELRLKQIASDPFRHVDVILCVGPSGTGKTEWAKAKAKELYPDELPFISSCGNDAFQGYAGQHVAILDDFRDDDFHYHDSLKVFDNFNRSSVKSRFTNKDFLGTHIIVTSNIEIYYWYQNRRNIKEDRVALMRRLPNYLRFTSSFISYSRFDYDKKDYVYKSKFENIWSQAYRDSIGSSDVEIPSIISSMTPLLDQAEPVNVADYLVKDAGESQNKWKCEAVKDLNKNKEAV